MSDDHSSAPTEHPDLLGLLRGELTNADVVLADAHLGSCEACRARLVEMAVGHGLLAGAGRTLAAAPSPTAGLRRDLPPAPVPPARSARWTRSVAAVAAAVVLVVGTAVVTSRVVGGGTGSGPVAGPDRTGSERSASLDPVEGRGAGKVRMVDHDGAVTMTLETHDLPRTGRGEFYYAWLFDPDSGKMLALGVVGPGGRASFELPDGLVGRYRAVDVSLERDDGDPGHSVTSVLRGSYADSGSASS